jgi:hypothetical protein
MKTRMGFVSNSSSSSFIIKKENLSEKQLKIIRIHTHYAKTHYPNEGFFCHDGDSWNINETPEEISGDTLMTNFDMEKFLGLIGVKDEDIQWEEEDYR